MTRAFSPYASHVGRKQEVSSVRVNAADRTDDQRCALGQELNLLKHLNVNQARFIALLAKFARMGRDARLGHVTEQDLDGVEPARGEHNPTAELGFMPVSAAASATMTLRDAVATLSAAARRELYALMRIGQGDLAVRKWHRGLSEAEMLGEETITAAIVEDPDLHDHLTKALYEAKLSA
jgi:hypothetical protein